MSCIEYHEKPSGGEWVLIHQAKKGYQAGMDSALTVEAEKVIDNTSASVDLHGSMSASDVVQQLRRSKRNRRPPDRYA